ncbi:MAG: molybdopterin converting factor subunit 1 [Rhodospirillaceae bacterium]|nr:MAG: molybdopterin converting factor subunit 1 [Rhodospirillaceae bacterium]
MTVLYFSWVKEKIGLSEETVTPPADVQTVAALMAWLAGRSAGHAAAFADTRTIKAAVDQVHAPPTASIADAREVAFFPPVTGG